MYLVLCISIILFDYNAKGIKGIIIGGFLEYLIIFIIYCIKTNCTFILFEVKTFVTIWLIFD